MDKKKNDSKGIVFTQVICIVMGVCVRDGGNGCVTKVNIGL